MPRRTRALAGFDPTVVVEDRGHPHTHETKYAVDDLGHELLLHTDTTTRAQRAQHRVAIALSRLAAALPRRAVTALRRSRTTRLRLAATSRRAQGQATAPAAAATLPAAAPVTSRRLAPSLATADAGEFAHPARTIEYNHQAEEDLRRADVLHALRRHQVPTTVVPAGAGQPAVVVVRDTDREHAATALAADLPRDWRMVPLEPTPVRGRKLRPTRLAKEAARGDGFRLYRNVPGPARDLVGEQVGVNLQFWADVTAMNPGDGRADSHAALVATRRQAWTSQLTAEQWQHATGTGLIDVGTQPHLFDVTGPIDVVYTWVDGADPHWNAQRMAALGLPVAQQAQEAATHAARFRSHDELRYSLRSLEMFAPWVRAVHIVTAGQVPTWLDTDHPRVQVVDHRDIFTDPEVLPVFNSHAIESQLHHVPGLAEQYLYLNDDVFFGRPVGPDLFFHGNGLAKFFSSSALIDAEEHQGLDVPVMSAAKNNRALIGQQFGRRVTHLFQHTPHPQLRSVLEQMEAEHPDLFAQVGASTFRHPDDLSISSALHHYYAYARGKAVPGRLAYLYLDLSHPRATARLRAMLRRRDFDVFCLNDTPGADDGSELVPHFLQQYFPLPSSFELPASTEQPGSTEMPSSVEMPRGAARQPSGSRRTRR